MVLPGVADVMASPLCPVSMFIRLDLPTFERPMKAYSCILWSGHFLTSELLIEKRALLTIIYQFDFWLYMCKYSTKSHNFAFMGVNPDREPVFRFKQFEVRDSVGAMKVGTDAVILGALTPVEDIQRALDIGTGTGILSLMLAQRGVGSVTGVEIDKAAADEAALNISRSRWRDSIEIVCGDVMEIDLSRFKPQLIICNPPFFADALKGPDEARNLARHEASLGFESLIRLSARDLDDDGLLAFISPADRESDIVFAMSIARMHIAKKTYIKTTHAKSPKRILWLSGKKNIVTETTTLIIHGNDSGYTDEYISLTSPFYLHL